MTGIASRFAQPSAFYPPPAERALGFEARVTLSPSARYVAVSDFASHALRNLLAPIQIRLDAWALSGDDAVIASHDVQRALVITQSLRYLLTGLDLLRSTSSADTNPDREPWEDCVRALLSCISSTDAPFTLEMRPEGRGRDLEFPDVEMAHFAIDVALAIKDAAPRCSLHLRVSPALDDDVNATLETINRTIVGARLDVFATTTNRKAHATLERVLAALVADSDLARVRRLPTIDSDHSSDVVHRAFEFRSSKQKARRLRAEFIAPIAPTMSVMCIDDNDSLMDALESRLSQESGFEWFLRATTLSDALQQLKRHAVSLVLLDVQLGITNDPLAAIVELRRACPQARIALFSGRADPELMRRARSLGADGFILKGTSSAALVDAIHQLGRGMEVWISDET